MLYVTNNIYPTTGKKIHWCNHRQKKAARIIGPVDMIDVLGQLQEMNHYIIKASSFIHLQSLHCTSKQRPKTGITQSYRR